MRASATRDLLAAIEHGPTRQAVDCERAFLAELGSGCSLPVGAHAVVVGEGELCLRTFLAGATGIYEGVHEGTADEAHAWAAEAARFVHVRLDVDDVTKLGDIAPFAWSRYQLTRDGNLFVYRQAVGAA